MKVILMPWGRVGSNFLLDILSQSDAVRQGLYRLHNEPLTGIRTRYQGSEAGVLLHQFNWIRRRHRQENRKGQGEGVVNLSVLSFAYPRILVPYLRRSTSHVLYLDRRNVVKTAVSVIIAQDYARAHEAVYGFKTWSQRADGANRITLPTPAPDPARLRATIRLLERARFDMNSLRQSFPGECLYYEDIKDNLAAAVERFWAALDLAPHPYRLRLSKAVSDDLSQSLANFDVLAESLPAPYRRQLFEGSPSAVAPNAGPVESVSA